MDKNVGVLVRAVPEPAKVRKDGGLVISLVIQPDDSSDRVKFGGEDVDFSKWPSEIASRLTHGSVRICFYCDDGQERSIPARRLEWVPLAISPNELKVRDDLWNEAIGPQALKAFKTHSEPLFVGGKTPDKLRIHASPVDKLALAAHAMASVSVYAQLAAHRSGLAALLSSPTNPLAKTGQQSQALFKLFEGARPNTPAEKSFGIIDERDYFNASEVTEKTIRRMENYALVNPRPKPRIDPFIVMKSDADETLYDRMVSTPLSYGRISPRMRQKLQRSMAKSAVLPINKRNPFRSNRSKRLNDESYYVAAAGAYLGKTIAEIRGSIKEPHLLRTLDDIDSGQDYADYLLSLQPDDEHMVKERSEKVGSDGTDEAEAALRTVAGMYAYPSLAAFFGLIVDVAIESSDLPDNPQYMRAELYAESAAAPFNSKVWTAVAKDSGRLKVRARNPASPAAQTSSGLLHLAENDRFTIVSLDVNAAIEGGLSAARNDYQAKLDGASNAELSSAQPAQRSVGLAIVDRWRKEGAADELDSSMPTGRLPPDNPRILFLEDLIVGYRIDVMTDRWSGTHHPWLSLMDREVEFPKLNEALQKAGLDVKCLSRQPEWGVDRLGGMVRSIHRDVQSNDGEDQAVVFETLATWRNWSLAVPSMGGHSQLGTGEIQLERTIAPRPGSLPVLRFGSSVKFGARCTLINGSSVSLDDAAMHYGRGNAPYVLFDGNGIPPARMHTGYPVLRHEPLATPRIFLPWAPKPKGQDIDQPSLEIVVRSDGKGRLKTPFASRIVLPGETSFDTAELHGALDSFVTLPARPFTKLALTPKLGAAPADPSSVTAAEEHSSLPSYPDPAVRFLSVAFTENGLPAETLGFAPPVIIDLYGSDQRGHSHHWPDAAALSIELEANGTHQLPLDGEISGDFEPRETRRDSSGLAHLKVRLLPAEQINLTIWPLPTLGDLRQLAPFVGAMHLASFSSIRNLGLETLSEKTPSLASGFQEFDEISTPERSIDAEVSNAPQDIIIRALRMLPIPALSSHQALRLVHAVEKPLLTPALNNFWIMHNPSISDGSENYEVRLRRAWAEKLASFKLDENERPSPEGAASFAVGQTTFSPGSNRVFFGGKLTFHRKSTDRIDLIASWEDWRDDIAPWKNPKSGKFCYRPEPHAENLDTVHGIEYRIEGATPDAIGLSLDRIQKPTYLSHTFRDTRARRLIVNARAVSRYRGNFKSQPEPEDPQFTIASNNTAGGDKEVVVLSTERPKPLKAPFCAPSLHYTLEVYKSADNSTPAAAGLRHSRTVMMRFDLGDRFYERGVEERVGVVCWPPDLFDAPEIPLVRNIGVDEIDTRIVNSIDTSGGAKPPEGAADFITRWGRDPIHDGGDLPALIPASTFRSAAKSARTVMPLPAAKRQEAEKPPANATLEVSLALYDPILDPDTGRFYVDIEINQNMTYEPWVRIGLVRYQEHSLTGLECSLPISCMVRIPADRQLEVEVSNSGRVSLRYSGVGYHGTYVPKAVRHVGGVTPLETSTLEVSVMHSSDEGTSGAPLVLERDVAPDGTPHIKMLKPRVSDGISEWVVGRFADGSASNDPQLRELVLPHGWDPAQVSILVTEHEHLAADNPLKTFGTIRSADGFEEPLSWNDSVPIESDQETVVTSRIVSAALVRLKHCPSVYAKY